MYVPLINYQDKIRNKNHNRKTIMMNLRDALRNRLSKSASAHSRLTVSRRHRLRLRVSTCCKRRIALHLAWWWHARCCTWKERGGCWRSIGVGSCRHAGMLKIVSTSSMGQRLSVSSRCVLVRRCVLLGHLLRIRLGVGLSRVVALTIHCSDVCAILCFRVSYK